MLAWGRLRGQLAWRGLMPKTFSRKRVWICLFMVCTIVMNSPRVKSLLGRVLYCRINCTWREMAEVGHGCPGTQPPTPPPAAPPFSDTRH